MVTEACQLQKLGLEFSRSPNYRFYNIHVHVVCTCAYRYVDDAVLRDCNLV